MYINGQKLTLKRFSSGELKITNSELCKHIQNNSVEILYDGEENFLELFVILRYYNNINTKINLILSYLPYQRMDHIGRDELDTINYVAKIFNGLNLNSITICEPHCKINMFNNSKEFSYINYIKQDVFNKINFNQQNDIVVLTDKGGLSRYGNLSNNVVYFNKVRDAQTGLISKHEIVGTVKPNSKCIIVDDIISTGDTILGVVEHLTLLGVKEIYLMSGHYENNKYNRRLLENNNIKKIFSTNSLKKRGTKKLKLYNIRSMFYGKNN